MQRYFFRGNSIIIADAARGFVPGTGTVPTVLCAVPEDSGQGIFKGVKNNKKIRGGYALFAFFAADLSAGAFFAGAAALLFFFDVAITSFSVVSVVYATYCCSLHAGIYAFFPPRNFKGFARVFS